MIEHIQRKNHKHKNHLNKVKKIKKIKMINNLNNLNLSLNSNILIINKLNKRIFKRI